MRKAHGNMYDWVDWMTDPVKYCNHYCKYCYAREWLKDKPILNHKELNTIRHNKGKIFVGYMGDLFCSGVPYHIIEETLIHCNKQQGNTYILQTKDPKRYWNFAPFFEDGNYLLGTTAETDKEIREISLAPHPSGRLGNMIDLSQAFNTFLTIEPIMDFDLAEFLGLITACNFKFINIGADSKRHNLPEPPAEKIKELITELKKFTKVICKKNLDRLLKEK